MEARENKRQISQELFKHRYSENFMFKVSFCEMTQLLVN